MLRELHRSEIGLARDLLAIADRHRADHEIFHIARDVATWSQVHVRRLAEVGRDHGLRLNPHPRWETSRAPVLELVPACHPQTLRQLRWTNAQLKVTSPQVIAS